MVRAAAAAASPAAQAGLWVAEMTQRRRAEVWPAAAAHPPHTRFHKLPTNRSASIGGAAVSSSSPLQAENATNTSAATNGITKRGDDRTSCHKALQPEADEARAAAGRTRPCGGGASTPTGGGTDESTSCPAATAWVCGHTPVRAATLDRSAAQGARRTALRDLDYYSRLSCPHARATDDSLHHELRPLSSSLVSPSSRLAPLSGICDRAS
jgi:hypothetical protein